MRHRRTDPACREFRRPRSTLGRWWFDRHRGLACPVCYGQHEHTWHTVGYGGAGWYLLRCECGAVEIG